MEVVCIEMIINVRGEFTVITQTYLNENCDRAAKF